MSAENAPKKPGRITFGTYSDLKANGGAGFGAMASGEHEPTPGEAVAEIQARYDRKRARSRLPLYAIRVIEVRDDLTVLFEMNGSEWITRDPWNGATPITTGNCFPKTK